jgi:hypothetical protein
MTSLWTATRASISPSDDEIEAAGARLYAEVRAEARANVEAMCRRWAAERAERM